MAKKKEEVKEVETVESSVPTFNATTIGHVKLDNGSFQMIEIKVNTESLQTEVKFGKICKDLNDAKYELKMFAFRNNLV
jgi:hypothetical protein